MTMFEITNCDSTLKSLTFVPLEFYIILFYFFLKRFSIKLNNYGNITSRVNREILKNKGESEHAKEKVKEKDI